MAGNIIPAIATTNAIIAGLLVLEAIKVLDNRFSDCRTVSFFISAIIMDIIIFVRYNRRNIFFCH